ncbi:uncharacterized protein LY89DRAFT_685411 [Mollisia scopiformis]|uniref:Uncharacterized protein n=1 Tax=Mollisia scopiformis TaxID=149040 RepID=A0A194X8J9_MOLSC|nr:uncharacterized protein LY89DRAFT_685411 [Mollisia scopiformis]KUJ16434.1 hypothetical protein LY89DRAFT_685411 [Mollisia scopiformis]
MAHVAVRYIQSLDIPNHPSPVFPVQPEPFFEDEESNECGRALENAVWGGYVTDFWIVRSDLRFSKMDSWAVLSVCVHNWVNFKFFPPDLRVVLPEQRQRIRFSENFQENAIASYWPVPVTFMENILQTDYWDTQVAQFTTQAFKPDRIFGHIIVRGATSKPEDESYLIALGPKYDDWVTESGKRVSTMEKIDYRTMDDIRYGKLIPADKQWRPIFDQTEAHAQKIQDAIDQQDRISNARKRRLSGAQGQATTKKQNTGTASPAGSTAGPPSSAGSSSRSRSASPSGSQSPLGC